MFGLLKMRTTRFLHRTDLTKPRFVLYWPMNVLHIVHLKKDVELAMSFSRLGYKSIVIVGKVGFKHQNPANGLQTILPQVLQTGYIRDGTKFNVKMYPFEILRSTFLLTTFSPELVLVIHAWVIAPLVIFNYKATSFLHRILRKRRPQTKFVLKMDSDGTVFAHGPHKYFWRLVLMANLTVFDFVVIETTCGAEHVRRLFPHLAKRKLRIIPSGYSLRLYHPGPADHEEREPTILTVARIVRSKGIDSLIRAFCKVHLRHPEWSIRIVGRIESVAYFQEILSLVRENNLEQSAVFLGEITEEQLYHEYTNSSIFCLPSRSEGFPAARLEAAAMGLPVVTTKAGCGRDLEDLGAIVGPIDDVEWLADALTELIENQEARLTHASSLQKHILSWDDVARKVIKIVSER